MTTSRRSPAEFIIAVVAVAIVAAFIAIGSSSGDDAPPSQTGDRGAAWDACKRAITKQLTNPSSADFALLSTDFAEQADGWSITGTVAATNDFGAEIELAYSCEVGADGSVDASVA